MSGEGFEMSGTFLGRSSRTGGDGDEVEFDRGQIAGMLVQADSSQLPTDAEALQVGVSAEVDIPAEHSGTDESDLDLL